MELFSDRKTKLFEKSKRFKLYIFLFFLIGLIYFIPSFGLFISFFVIIIYLTTKSISKRVKEQYSDLELFEYSESIEKTNDIKETLNIIEELKVLYSVNYNIKILIAKTDFILTDIDTDNDLLIFSFGFSKYLKRSEKTFILERLIFIEKENIFRIYEITKKIEENQNKYKNLLNSVMIKYLDELDKEFNTKKRLDKIRNNPTNIKKYKYLNN